MFGVASLPIFGRYFSLFLSLPIIVLIVTVFCAHRVRRGITKNGDAAGASHGVDLALNRCNVLLTGSSVWRIWLLRYMYRKEGGIKPVVVCH